MLRSIGYEDFREQVELVAVFDLRLICSAGRGYPIGRTVFCWKQAVTKFNPLAFVEACYRDVNNLGERRWLCFLGQDGKLGASA
jgi:hypothetical protein